MSYFGPTCVSLKELLLCETICRVTLLALLVLILPAYVISNV